MMIVDQQDRIFQVWAYSVGMSRLLLRSTRTEEHPTRIDVLFQGVRAMQLPTTLPGLQVQEASLLRQEEIARATGLLVDEETKFFVLAGASFEGYVVAGVCVEDQDTAEYFEPSRLWPDR